MLLRVDSWHMEDSTVFVHFGQSFVYAGVEHIGLRSGFHAPDVASI